MRLHRLGILLVGAALLLGTGAALAQQAGFTQDDRNRMIRMEQRFEQVDQRFKDLQLQVDQRFEQVDQRFKDLQLQMEQRFEQVQEQIRFIHQILVALLVMTLGSPFLVEFLRSRRERREQETLEQVRRLFVAMREEAAHDERLRHMLESAKLL